MINVTIFSDVRDTTPDDAKWRTCESAGTGTVVITETTAHRVNLADYHARVKELGDRNPETLAQAARDVDQNR